MKILYKSLVQTQTEGLKQTWAYMDQCNTNHRHLIIFDRTPDRTWEEKICCQVKEHKGQQIVVWGM